jgi:hypothetical protein
LCLAAGRPVPGALQAERDLVAECLVAAREAESPWDEAKAADRERASLLERRAAGEVPRRGAAGAAARLLAPPRSPQPSSSRAPSPPQTPSSLPPSQPLSPGSARSTGSVSPAGRERLQAAKKRSRRRSAEFAASAKRRRLSSRDARDLVESTETAVARVRSMLDTIATSGPSFLGVDAAAAIASLDAFLETARRS